MLAIKTVAAQPAGNPHQQAAHALFGAYGDFLRVTQSCNIFDFPRYDEEIRTLPTFYTGLNGEVLLALVDDTPAACIAYRANDAETLEIKRLFVLNAFRGQGLARALIAEVLDRAAGFPRIILDTDVVHMRGALALYQSFGFKIYAPQQGNIAFLELLR